MKWISEARPVESGPSPAKNDAVDFNFNLQVEKLKQFDEVLKIATGELPSVQIVDARFSKLYEQGHIPGSKNLQYSSVIGEDNTLKSVNELK